jgi:hypothetical protein
MGSGKKLGVNLSYSVNCERNLEEPYKIERNRQRNTPFGVLLHTVPLLVTFQVFLAQKNN